MPFFVPTICRNANPVDNFVARVVRAERIVSAVKVSVSVGVQSAPVAGLAVRVRRGVVDLPAKLGHVAVDAGTAHAPDDLAEDAVVVAGLVAVREPVAVALGQGDHEDANTERVDLTGSLGQLGNAVVCNAPETAVAHNDHVHGKGTERLSEGLKSPGNANGVANVEPVAEPLVGGPNGGHKADAADIGGRRVLAKLDSHTKVELVAVTRRLGGGGCSGISSSCDRLLVAEEPVASGLAPCSWAVTVVACVGGTDAVEGHDGIEDESCPKEAIEHVNCMFMA